MPHCGVLLSPRRRLNHRGCCRGHGQASLRSAILAVRDFSTDLAAPEDREMDEGTTSALAKEGLEYMSNHFLPRHKTWLKDGRTWALHRGGWGVHSRTDYILGTDICLFQNVAV